ncbi:MAG: peptide deformylase [Anaerolineae bacterium]|nr:peptide deformylase [Anaerolineae bacterium]MDW8070546.1 peptide deformylase [Anaerolineae bacterium]
MAIRRILYADDPRLRQKAKPVKRFGPELKALADDMLETMRAANGLGLAAPQIGILQQLFVAHLPKDEADPQSGKDFVLVNPQIVQASPERVEGVEGCLSIPTWYGRVARAEWVVVKAQNVHGKPVRIKAHGLLARVFQHEIDHLNGVLFVDHIRRPEDVWQELPKEASEKQPAAQVAAAVEQLA